MTTEKHRHQVIDPFESLLAGAQVYRSRPKRFFESVHIHLRTQPQMPGRIGGCRTHIFHRPRHEQELYRLQGLIPKVYNSHVKVLYLVYTIFDIITLEFD